MLKKNKQKPTARRILSLLDDAEVHIDHLQVALNLMFEGHKNGVRVVLHDTERTFIIKEPYLREAVEKELQDTIAIRDGLQEYADKLDELAEELANG